MSKRKLVQLNKSDSYFTHEVQDIFKEYHGNSSVTLDEYAQLLTKYKLLRLSHIFLPLNITKGCITPKKVNNLLTLFYNNNRDLRSLNLSNCIISLETIQKLQEFPNLKSLNLSKSFQMMFHGYIDARNQQKNVMRLLSEFSLIYLDISNNSTINEDLSLMCVSGSNLANSLQYLNLSSTIRSDVIDFDYSIFTQLNILNISSNFFYPEQLQQISGLKLKELHAKFINIPTSYYNFLNNKDLLQILINDVIIHMKTLEVLDISNFWKNINTREVIMNYLVPNLPNIKIIKMVDLEQDSDSISEQVIIPFRNKKRTIEIIYSSIND